MKIIKGNSRPKAEEKNFYEVTSLIPDFNNVPFLKKEDEKLVWTLFKNVKNNWQKVQNNIKYGKKVPYTFGEKVVGIPYKIEVHSTEKNIFSQNETKLVASLTVTPSTAKEPTIGKVILLNRQNSNVNVAKFNESLSAEARTANLFGKEITFYLWEEGTKEEDKYKKPKKAKVDKNGIAKVKFNLSEYASQKTFMDFFTGDSNSTKKFFVTAIYEKKNVTNNTPVIASDTTNKNEEQSAKKDSEGVYGVVEKTTEVIAEGIEKVWDMISDKAKTAISVGREELKNVPKQNEKGECCVIDEEFFLTNYEKEFPTKDKHGKIIPLSGLIKISLRKIFKSISEYYSNEKKCCNKYKIAYMLSTVKHETGHTFNPVEEANWLSWKSRKKYFEDMYDPVLGKNKARKDKAIEIGNSSLGDGVKYFGRGYVQITGKTNYQKMTDKFNVDFVNDMTKVTDHEWAMKILIYGSEDGIFTGKKLSDYISASKQDYNNARRVINGTDEALRIAGYAEKIEKCLKIKDCNCGDSKASNHTTSNCVKCYQDHYDVASTVKWQTQFDAKWGDSKAQNVACKKTCDDILNKSGLASTSKAGADKYQTALENDKHTAIVIDSKVSKQAVEYINKQLEAGNPVQVGVDHDLNYKGGLNEGTTDHFIVIIGKGCDNGKIYYRFYDVGTKYEHKGSSTNNKLFLGSDNSLKGATVYNGNFYTVTQVRKNKKK